MTAVPHDSNSSDPRRGRPAPSTGCAYCRETETMLVVGERLARCSVCGFILALARGETKTPQLTSTAVDLPLAPGTLLRERYRLVELIGTGAQGITYLAHHERLDHPCVVKALPYRIQDGLDGGVQRLRKEASAGFRVNHPNVVRVLDSDAFEGIWYFVTEYVEGVDLAAVMARSNLVDWRQAVRFAVDAAHGLDAIHRAGLVHRDLKPGNLILGTNGQVRIADLGMVGLIPGGGAPDGNVSDLAGSLAYAAPEVYTPGGHVGPPADLYSLGATIFELVTGSLPHGDSVYRTLLGSDHGGIFWPGDAPEDVPGWLIEAILRLLEGAPEKRPESARALAEQLEQPGEVGARKPASAVGDYPEPRGLVVLPFDNALGTSDEDWLGQALADHLAQSLEQVPGAYVVDLAHFLQAMERVGQRAGGSQTQQLLEAGRLSGAATVITGEFRRRGESIELSADAHRSDLRAPIAIEQVHGALSRLVDLEGELFGRLTVALGIGGAEAPPRVKLPVCNVVEAEERFFTAKRAFLRGDYELAMRLGKEATELDAGFGDALGLVGGCCYRMGRYDEAIEYSEKQQTLAARKKDERLKVQAQANQGAMHYFRGQHEAAKGCLTHAARIAERLGLVTELAHIQNNLGFVLLQLGQQAEARETLMHAVDTLKKYGALMALIAPYNGIGHVLREEKRYEEARGYFRRALGLAQESDDSVNMGIAYMNLGYCAALQGRLADAKHELAVAENILEQTSFWNGLARVYQYMADLNLRLRNWTQAVGCAEKRIGLAQRHSNVRMEGDAWRQKAEILTLAGRIGEADACLVRAGGEHGGGEECQLADSDR